jgi:serine/threonine-protein kinase Chk2
MTETTATTVTATPVGAKEQQQQPWGKLVSLNPKYPSIDLVEDRVTVGRAMTTLGITNTAISSAHFQIWRERGIGAGSGAGSAGSDDWIFFVTALSTNGTFMNGERLHKNVQSLIENGTDVSVLNPKKSVEYITFTFLDLLQEQREIAEGGPQQRYEIQQVLGTGQFAAVRLVVERATGTRYAMKVIEKRKFNTSTKRPGALMDEVKILLAVSHVNIIGIKELFQTQRRLYIVLELVTGGELFDSIVEEKRFTEDKARGITRQVLDAIAYLHGRGIAHRDLKPENILLAEKGSSVVKISDFGLSRIIDEGSFARTMCGTPQYVAPEVLLSAGSGYTSAVDLWSIGVILYVMLAGF